MIARAVGAEQGRASFSWLVVTTPSLSSSSRVAVALLGTGLDCDPPDDWKVFFGELATAVEESVSSGERVKEAHSALWLLDLRCAEVVRLVLS